MAQRFPHIITIGFRKSATTETQKTIEKSLDYIIKPKTAERLKKAVDHCHRSEIKFIVVSREPFERAVSEYVKWKLYLKYRLGKTVCNFETWSIKKSGEVNKFYSQVRPRGRDLDYFDDNVQQKGLRNR